MSPNEILFKILDDVRTQVKCAAVFDLDSTLFCVSPRSQAILRDLAAEPSFARQFPEVATILARIEVLPTEYGIRSALMRMGVKPVPGMVEQIIQYWRDRFFANTHMHHDVTYPGAQDFVRRLHEGGTDVYYLTGRAESKQREGTMQNLKTWSFPDLPIERVILKTRTEDEDHIYKEQRLKEIAGRYPKVWFFENEPVIIHHVRRELPDVHIVFIESAHSGKANPPTDLMTVRMDFR